MKKTIITLIASIAWLTIQASNLVTCTGKVIDGETGRPIHATITYETLPFGNAYGIVTTDHKTGEYKTVISKNNNYKVNIRAYGYISFQTTIQQSSLTDDVVQRVFTLNPAKPGDVISSCQIGFPKGTAVIKEEFIDELNELAVFMLNHPSMVVQLEGHTDYAGDANNNLKLSEDRVDIIRDYLIGVGIKPKRIKTIGFGESKPIIIDHQASNRIRNRRVEVRLLQL